jgi:tight adherence protein B
MSPALLAGAVAVLLGTVAPAARAGLARRRLRDRLGASGRASPRPRRAPVGAVALGSLGMATAWLAAGPGVALVLVAAAMAAPVRAGLRRRGALRRRRDAQLPGALDRLAASLRSGASLTMALDEVGSAIEPPLGRELTGLAREASRGRPLVHALDDWSAAHDDAGTRLAATALVLATVIGSAPARALDGVAATVRERLDLAAERRALATQARTSSLVLSVAPVAFAVLLMVSDGAAAGFLLGTPAGWACLAAGAGLDAAGAWWMVRLSRSGLS